METTHTHGAENMISAIDNAPNTVHPFERAGLGIGPFRYIGYSHEVTTGCTEIDGTPTMGLMTAMPMRPGASCAYCGTAISHVYHVRSADGRTFKVGSSCIEKTNAKGTRIHTQVQKKVRKVRSDARKARQAARIAAARVAILEDAHRATLASDPHPNAWRASQGDTLLSWAEWMMDNAGTAGRMKVAKLLGC